MPFSTHGIGTAFCKARGFTRWGGAPDYDAVECFVFAFMPIIPYRAVHVFEVDGDEYRTVAIAFSTTLVVRAFAIRWLWIPVYVGVCFTIAGFDPGRQNPNALLIYGIPGLCILVASISGLLLWRITDQRNRNIRYVLGTHAAGSSDPATWGDDLLQRMNTPRELFGTSTYVDAVDKMLQLRLFSNAMWAARLAVVVENRTRGEELTEVILGDVDVQTAIRQVRKDPSTWQAVMNPAR